MVACRRRSSRSAIGRGSLRLGDQPLPLTMRQGERDPRRLNAVGRAWIVYIFQQHHRHDRVVGDGARAFQTRDHAHAFGVAGAVFAGWLGAHGPAALALAPAAPATPQGNLLLLGGGAGYAWYASSTIGAGEAEMPTLPDPPPVDLRIPPPLPLPTEAEIKEVTARALYLYDLYR